MRKFGRRSGGEVSRWGFTRSLRSSCVVLSQSLSEMPTVKKKATKKKRAVKKEDELPAGETSDR